MTPETQARLTSFVEMARSMGASITEGEIIDAAVTGFLNGAEAPLLEIALDPDAP